MVCGGGVFLFVCFLMVSLFNWITIGISFLIQCIFTGSILYLFFFVLFFPHWIYELNIWGNTLSTLGEKKSLARVPCIVKAFLFGNFGIETLKVPQKIQRIFKGDRLVRI